MTITDWPVSWYPVTTSKKLRIGSVQVHRLGGNDLVVARSESGAAFALDAHCPHMGAHLRHASVVGEGLRCPLHHWHLASSGECVGQQTIHRSWLVQELLGLVFVGFAGEGQNLPPLPGEGILDQYHWTTGEPVDIRLDWKAAIVNGFDLTHLSTVHHREIIDDPAIDIKSTQLVLSYQSRVTGTSVADKITKYLSDNRLGIEQRCLGTTIEVRSQLKRISTAAIVSMLPTAHGVRVFCVFGVRPGPLAFWRGLLARHLFTGFLKKDIQVLTDMRMRLDVAEDAGVRGIANFLSDLSEGPVSGNKSVVDFPVAVRVAAHKGAMTGRAELP